MEEIAGLPFWEVAFDAAGNPGDGAVDTLLAEVRNRGITDLIVFAHGWNTDPTAARRLYESFAGLIASQLIHVPDGRTVTVGLAGVLWPSQRWSDEPIPDFRATASVDAAVPATRAGGAASLADRATQPQRPASLGLDDQQLDMLHSLFPNATAQLDIMADLLDGPPSFEAIDAFHAALVDFSATVAIASTDGEDDAATPLPAPGAPRMLRDDATVLFERYRDALVRVGAELEDGGGQAGIGDALGGILHGAKEALRQATYWQMKNRAGHVGQQGLGPLLGALDPTAVRVHLVGHSFGARLVSFALAGLPAGRSPVRSMTLLQAAFSHFAFADPLPFDAGRRGALAGMQARVNGPLVACFSEHDSAVGTFYPLASFAAQDDSAAADEALSRWGGIGAGGVRGVSAPLDIVQPAGPGTVYRFATGRALNVDASQVVRRGGPPSGAHSDIVHPELTWIVLSAGGIV
jgi:hypothetical protein